MHPNSTCSHWSHLAPGDRLRNTSVSQFGPASAQSHNRQHYYMGWLLAWPGSPLAVAMLPSLSGWCKERYGEYSPKPSPHMCSFFTALSLLPTSKTIRLPVHNCLPCLHHWLGSAAAASYPSMTGRVRLLNESKRTHIQEYQS